MRLLVSVRSAAEVGPALAGGAEIIDAKEPSLGSLGPVSASTLRAILHRVPSVVPLSLALGDPGSATGAAEAIAALGELGPRRAELYVKLGLAGVRGKAAGEALVSAAVEAAASTASRPAVVVVAYADHAAAGAPPRDAVRRMAAFRGARGVLLDTFLKDGRTLFDHVAEPELRAWIDDASRAGLLVALAGSLSPDGVRRAAELPADIVGVRGAACVGGREGRVRLDRVRLLRSMLVRQAGRTAPVG